MTMNIFRFAADMIHLLSFFLLFGKIHKTKSVEGLSLKTQELYLLVFVTRYLDLFLFDFHNSLMVYNWFMKVIFIASSATIVYYFRMKDPWRSTYRPEEDSFLHVKFAIAPCAVLALFIHPRFHLLEILWSFSIYLEAITIMPQLILLQRYRNIENVTANYVFCLGAYRALYILNWIYRGFTEEFYNPNYAHWIVWISGAVQTLLYADFFYYYLKSKYSNGGGGFQLPK